MKAYIKILFVAIISLAAFNSEGSLVAPSATNQHKATVNSKATKMEKKCSKCGDFKKLNDFYNDKDQASGLRPECKECNKLRDRTKEGRLKQIFNAQKSHRNYKKLSLPEYTLGEFVEWGLNQSKYNEIHNNWVVSGYKKELSPSVDRIKNELGYSFNNIQLVTWKHNFKKSNIDIREGRLVTINLWYGGIKPIIGNNIDTGEVKKFISVSDAKRKLQLQSGNICKVLKGTRNHTGNWTFKYL